MGDWLFSYDSQDRLTAAAGGLAPSVFQGQSGAGRAFCDLRSRRTCI
jgi:hypothetical protein